MSNCVVETVPLYVITGKKPKKGCSPMVKIAIYSEPEDLELLEIFEEKVDYVFQMSELPKKIDKYLIMKESGKYLCDSCEDKGDRNEITNRQRNTAVS